MAINPDRISAAQAKLAEDPHDVDSWVLLIKHCQCRLDCKSCWTVKTWRQLNTYSSLSCYVFSDYMEPLRSIDEARETYEELVATFPTSGRYWKAYIEQVDLLPGPVCFTGLKMLFRRSERATMSALNFFSSAVLSEFSPSSSGKPICSTSRCRRFSHLSKTSCCNFFSSIGDKSLSDHLQGEDGPGLRFCSG